MNVEPGSPELAVMTFKVLRLDQTAQTATVVGETVGAVRSGPNSIAARVPISEGDRITVFGSGLGAVYCSSGANGSFGEMTNAVLGSPPPHTKSPMR